MPYKWALLCVIFNAFYLSGKKKTIEGSKLLDRTEIVG